MSEIIKLTEQEISIEESKEFLQFVEAAKTIKESCKSIKITDQNSYDDANQRIVSAKKIMKEIDNTRLSATKEYRNKTDIINNLGNRLKSIIEDGVKYGSSLIISYNQEIERKKQEELKRIIEEQRKRDIIKTDIENMFNNIVDKICKCKTVEELQTSVFPSSIKNANNNASAQLLEKKVIEMNDESLKELFDKNIKKILEIGKEYKVKLLSGNNDDTQVLEKIEEAKSNVNETIDYVAIETNATLKALENTKLKNQRMTIKYSLSDIDKVPEKYKTVILNEKAIKSYIKIHGAKIFDNGFNAIPGVRFIKEYSHVSK